MAAVADLYGRITEKEYPVRRMFINFNDIKAKVEERQMTLFDLSAAEDRDNGVTAGQARRRDKADPIAAVQVMMKRDSTLQETVNTIRNKYGKDAVIRAMDLEAAATTIERNHQVGGHKE